MELNKTKCINCGHINAWYGYKWVDRPERAEHNRKNSKECPKCGSTNVKNHEDDETMGMARAVAGVLGGVVERIQARRQAAEGAVELPEPILQNPPVTEESYHTDPVAGPAMDAHANLPIDPELARVEAEWNPSDPPLNDGAVSIEGGDLIDLGDRVPDPDPERIDPATGKPFEPGFWRCMADDCGGLNSHGMFAGPYRCFSCGAPEPTAERSKTTFIPVEAGAFDFSDLSDERAARQEDADAEFLRDLATRLGDVPVKYGVGQGDIDTLTYLAERLARQARIPLEG